MDEKGGLSGAIAKDDPRLDFLNDYLQRTYRTKGDKWQKLMTSDDKVTKLLIYWFPWIFF